MADRPRAAMAGRTVTDLTVQTDRAADQFRKSVESMQASLRVFWAGVEQGARDGNAALAAVGAQAGRAGKELEKAGESGRGLPRPFASAGKSIEAGLLAPLEGVKTALGSTKKLAQDLLDGRAQAGLTAVGSALLNALTAARRMQTAIGHLREGFARMAAPLVSAAVPALAALTNGLATAMAYAGRLFSFLTGKAVKSTTGTAAAVAKVGSAAGKTAKAAAEAVRSLAGFDEIERLEAPKSAGSGAGGGKAGGSTTTQKAKGWVAASPFLEQVLAAIEGGDWGGAGKLLAQKLDSVLTAWDAAAFGTRLGTGLLNALALAGSFLQNGPWAELGAKLALGFNAMVAVMDPAVLAAALGGWLNAALGAVGGFLQTLDWAQLGETASLAFAALAQQLAATVAGIDWGQIGSGVLAGLQAIDWAAVASSLGLLLATMFRAAVDLCTAPFRQAIEEAGGNVPLGLFNGIVQGLIGLPGWIWDNLLVPFANGVCEAFGIHSPSTVAAGWGGDIAAGLLQGLQAGWQQILGFLGQMCAGFQAGWQAISSAVRPVADVLWQGLAAGWQAVCTALQSGLAGLQGAFATVWGAIRGAVRPVADALWQGLAAGWQAACTALQSGLAGLQEGFATVWGAITATVQGAADTIGALVGGIAQAISGALAAAGNFAANAYSRLSGARVAALPLGAGPALAAPAATAASPIGAALPQPILPAVAVPALAGGAVLPTNGAFLAAVGGGPRRGGMPQAGTVQEAVRAELQGQLDAMMAGFEAVVAAIQNKDMDVYIGDEPIGRAAARYQARMGFIEGSAY